MSGYSDTGREDCNNSTSRSNTGTNQGRLLLSSSLQATRFARATPYVVVSSAKVLSPSSSPSLKAPYPHGGDVPSGFVGDNSGTRASQYRPNKNNRPITNSNNNNVAPRHGKYVHPISLAAPMNAKERRTWTEQQQNIQPSHHQVVSISIQQQQRQHDQMAQQGVSVVICLLLLGAAIGVTYSGVADVSCTTCWSSSSSKQESTAITGNGGQNTNTTTPLLLMHGCSIRAVQAADSLTKRPSTRHSSTNWSTPH